MDGWMARDRERKTETEKQRHRETERETWSTIQAPIKVTTLGCGVSEVSISSSMMRSL